jgi:very-short-patch-repair endonuclease
MVDRWQSDWFMGIGNQKCRIVYEEKGMNLHELLEYEDKRRDRFLWQGALIYGFTYTRLGNRCIQVPESVIREMNEFLNGLSKGVTIIRNGTMAWRK